MSTGQARATRAGSRPAGRAACPRCGSGRSPRRRGGAEHGVAHQRVLGGLGEHLVLDAHVAQDLHRALVGDVRARGVGHPPVFGDHDVVDAQRGQEQCGRRPGGARPTIRTSVVTVAACGGWVSAIPSLNSAICFTFHRCASVGVVPVCEPRHTRHQHSRPTWRETEVVAAPRKCGPAATQEIRRARARWRRSVARRPKRSLNACENRAGEEKPQRYATSATPSWGPSVSSR